MSFFESSKTRSTLSYRVTNKIHIFSPFPGAQFLKPGAIEDGTMVAQKKKKRGGGAWVGRQLDSDLPRSRSALTIVPFTISPHFNNYTPGTS